jgi:hypothetical protein
MDRGMCCIEHLRECIEERRLYIAGFVSGVLDEPSEYRYWLAHANARLVELESGNDNYAAWSKLLELVEEQLSSWIWTGRENIEESRRPNFSLHTFCLACKAHNFEPNVKDTAHAFGYTEDDVNKCWSKLSETN